MTGVTFFWAGNLSQNASSVSQTLSSCDNKSYQTGIKESTNCLISSKYARKSEGNITVISACDQTYLLMMLQHILKPFLSDRRLSNLEVQCSVDHCYHP